MSFKAEVYNKDDQMKEIIAQEHKTAPFTCEIPIVHLNKGDYIKISGYAQNTLDGRGAQITLQLPLLYYI